MLLDKLPWCNHGGEPIFSLHVQPNGARFATASADNTVRVWALPPALDARQERQGGVPKLLATATDHNGPVNVVRFAHAGAAMASGSDDGVVCVYELRSGPGGGILGAESNIENWRIKHVLRGHESHVVDLGWSPDDALIATASLDSTASIWDVATGNRVATLRAHSSFVKGVAWDPVGTYLATLSEDRSVAVWRREDWSLVAAVTAPFDQMVTATFACRLSWSPDGRLLLAGNSFQGATHAAVAVPREAWDRPEEYLLVCGHDGAVVATGFSPKLFRVPPLGGGPPGEDLSSVFAIGGQDKRITVWASSADRPIFCGARLFKSQVLDLAWTPDGEALLASSSDGTVACLQFERAELGEPASKEDMEEVMRALYGSAAGRTARRAIAESAVQLELEAAAAPGPKARRQVLKPVAQQAQVAQAPAAAAPAAAAAAAKPAAAAAAPADPLAALDARLGGGAAAAGAVTQTGFGGASGAPGSAAAAVAAAPRPTDLQLMPPPAARAPAGAAPPPKRPRVEMVPAAAAAQAAPVAAAAALRLAPLRPAPALRVVLGAAPPLVGSGSRDAAPPPLELHVANKAARPGAAAHAEVALTQGEAALWTDAVAGAVVAAAGTPAFTALATADGCLLLYTPAGRRMAPPLRLGAGVALLAAAGGGAPGAASRVLTLTTAGRLKLLDVLELREVMEADVAPLVEGGAGILDARLSPATGVPVVTLNDASAYVWHEGLRAWLRVADDSLASSRFAPVPLVPGQGPLAEVQAEALAGQGAPRLGAAAAEAALARGVAEGNLAAAEALGSPGEYRAWLTTYARGLANAGDEPRLRELADALLGPPPGAGDGAWAPAVLGLGKRRLLREVVLVEAARNRALGGLLQRCQQALDEVEAAEVGAA